MTDTVQQIKDRLSIVDVVSMYVKLERAGASLRARCPFHAERTPSFFVSADRGTYHCFGCNVGGDIFSFIEQIEGLDFKGALKILAEKAGVPLVYEKPEKKDERDRLFELMEVATIFYSSRLSDDATKYLKERGLNEATIKEFRLGWAGEAWTEATDYLKSKKFTDKEIIDAGIGKKGDRGTLDKFRNRIMFPINDSAGRVIAFSGRIFGENASPEAPKYLNSPETPLFHKSRILYGFDRAKVAIRKLSCAILVEGQMDLLASHQAGWVNTVAVSGTAFTPEHATLIHRMTDNLVLALDADEAGIKAAGRAARAALQGGLNVKVAQIPEGLDPADLIQKQGADAWKGIIKNSTDIITFLLDVLEKHAKAPDAFRRTVELVVLPFLTDVSSPIAREQYIQEIAKRLKVSGSAVHAAFAQLPKQQGTYSPTSESARKTDSTPLDSSRDGSLTVKKSDVSHAVRDMQAYGILIWQESLPTAAIDLKKYVVALKEVLSEEEFKYLQSLHDTEKQSLMFNVERLFEKTALTERHAHELLRVVHKDRLESERAAATLELKAAEERGDTREVARLTGVVDILIKRIAQIHEEV
ncbi:MAG: DNA primase [bacterium]|nr:DNA primase [bacterium]